MKRFFAFNKFWIFVIIVIALGAGVAVTALQTPPKEDVYVHFVMEGYDKIKDNYWKKVDDATLSHHFQLSLQKAGGKAIVPELATSTRNGTALMVAAELAAATTTQAKKDLARNTLIVATYNLYPIGRSGLFSEDQEKNLRETVANVNPNKDLYQDLGLKKGVSADAVKLAYDNKAEILKNTKTPEAQAELKKLTYAKDVLVNPSSKEMYDQAKIEPTASIRVIGKTLYIKIDKISPTTLIEFGRTIFGATTTRGLNSMIVDLRGNLGGSLDFATHFLGLFIGPNQYAFDLFHQDEYKDQRTAEPRFVLLDRYQDIAILTDGMTQSSAEVTAAAFKRFKLGTVVGAKTRGWGTVENTFPFETILDKNEKYSLFLVHSLTIRDDGQPIEGNGVEPNINTTDPNWKKILNTSLKSEDLIQAVFKVM